MAKCAVCGKDKIVGRQVTFSGKRNRRVFKPNLQAVWTLVGNLRVRKRMCTKCLRKYRKTAASSRAQTVVSKQPVVLTP